MRSMPGNAQNQAGGTCPRTASSTITPMSPGASCRSRLVVHLRRQHLPHQIRVDEAAPVQRLRELGLRLERGLGQPGQGYGEVPQLHRERELCHELLDRRGVVMLEEARDGLDVA